MEREMMERKREDDQEKWVFDSSVDHQGRVPLRASTGVWKAALFIITVEFSERLSFFGLSANLITYLTKVLQQDLKTAAKNVNYWSGVTAMMPLLGGFIADAYTGRFYMILISSAIYLLGLGILTMSRFIPSLKPCHTAKCSQPSKVHEIIFFLAMYFISIATGGYKPSLESFGADQFDEYHPEERKKKISYFNWWNFALCCGLVISVTFVVYMQDYISWGVTDLVLTVILTVNTIIFYIGRPFYRFRAPQGSPLVPMLQVIVAAIAKRKLPHPPTPASLYEIPASKKSQASLLGHTNKLRFLDRAAIVEINKKPSPWRLATVTQVEELKLILNMVPIWLTSLTFGTCVAQTPTFFIKQSSTLNRKISHNFEIPPATIYALTAVGMIIAVTVYDKLLVPILRRITGNERGISILQRIGFGMIFAVLAMSVAALVERRRLGIVHKQMINVHGGKPESFPMSVFWLTPQFMILGVGDAFTLVGLQEYFYDQVPDSMRSLGIAFYLSVLGVGNFISSFLITLVNHLVEKLGGSSWFGKDLNSSRIDNFYWLLAIMSGLNLCVFVFVARRYSYKKVQTGDSSVVNCEESSMA